MSLDSLFQKFKPYVCLMVICLGAALSACSVQPLYQGSKEGASQFNVAPSMREKLSAIIIDEPTNRFNQLVRNRLIFLLNQGAGEAQMPKYQLTLGTSYSIRSAVQLDIGDTTDRTGRASAGTVVGNSTYVLRDMDNKPVARGRRSVSASFDRPRQEYANLQAEQDGQKRAAEELAEQIFLSLAQDVSKLP
ncbi:LPS assembly lipoprotein LptE [Bartonella tamiae]|uniref:LPS assembly lipoprotein LptE n=1 Tax=Bartonella tamiae TaxID=373638 RepID=UPI003CC91508